MDTEEEVVVQSEELQAGAEKLLASNRLMEGLLDNLPIGVFVASADGKALVINKTASELTGRRFKDLVGRIPRSYVLEFNLIKEDGTPYPDEELPLNITLKKGTTASRRDLFIMNKNDKKLSLSMISSPVFDAEKKLELVIVIFQDTTEEYRIDRAKTEFVSLASHQLRTPLSAMNWYSEMLIKGYAGELSKTQTNFVEEIYKSSKRMSELVSTLLNVSRIELGSFAVEPVSYDLSKLIRTIIGELQLSISEKKIEVTQKYIPDPLMSSIDVKLMGIVIENLLTNAIKYTAEGGKVKISAEKDKDGIILLSIADTGYGIPKSAQSKIFSKMYRADNIKSMDTQGNGLGLYMVKSILNSSNCDIKFESEENKGTTFYITIPKEGMTKKEGKKHLSGMQS